MENRFCGLLLLIGLSWLPLKAQITQNTVNVSSVTELRSAMENSNQHIIMQPGDYKMGSQTFKLSGSNNTIELTGAYFSWVVGEVGRGRMMITGHGNTIRNGEFEDVYYNGMTEVTDFTAYNQDRNRLANGGGSNISITGDNNRLEGFKMTVRGSYPYGYGAMFGIGRYHSVRLDKHGGIVIKAKNTVLDGVEVQQKAFCHAIFMQSPADNTVIKNCLVEGAVRETNDMYRETDPNSLPRRFDYKMPFSIAGERYGSHVPIPRDHVFTMTEDGIRIYTGGGSVTVENTTVKKTRGGIRLYLGRNATVKNCTAIDCGSTNFNLPRGGTITGSSGNSAYGPLSDFRLGRSNQNIDMTILPSPHAMGDHNIADIQGNSHTIVLRRAPGPIDKTARPIVVTGDNSTIRNETEYSIILESSASANTVVSFGPVTDHGTNNIVTQLGQGKARPSKSSSSLQTEPGAKFTHPGLLHNQAELDFIRQKVEAEEEPWFSGWKPNDSGQCQESGRDQSHVQMGIGFLGAACEIAWKQGVDLYGAYDNRLALGFEYTAKYNLGHDVPFEPYSSIDGRYKHTSISRRGRGRFRPIYERAYHHYHDRMGLDMPYTLEVIQKMRPEGWHIQHTSWGTLLHAGLPVSKQTTKEPVVTLHAATHSY